jgi:hypothetical protein
MSNINTNTNVETAEANKDEIYVLLELSEYEDTNLLTTCKNYSIIVRSQNDIKYVCLGFCNNFF